jgi:GNAT superfamily N-acetyltransferase
MGDDGYRITRHDPAGFSDDEIRRGNAFANAIRREVRPDDPPTPDDEAIAANRSAPAWFDRVAFRAWSPDGELVGTAGTGIDRRHDDNPDLLGCGLHVHPDHRRRGLGTRLLAELVRHAEAEGRARLLGDTNGRVPAGDAFAAALGAVAKARGHVNHLLCAEADRHQLERWVAEGPDRAPGYRLLTWDGPPTPQEHREAFRDLVLVMNTAPHDDLELNDFTVSEEQQAANEAQMAAMGHTSWTVVAVAPDGAFAGFHDLTFTPTDTRAWVGSTGVRPEHRGHALGKWLKARLMLRLLDERPDVDSVRTGNADSNDAMLGINRAMGYRPLMSWAQWELRTDEARPRLEATGALPVEQVG